jgi:hypothetical protein
VVTRSRWPAGVATLFAVVSGAIALANSAALLRVLVPAGVETTGGGASAVLAGPLSVPPPRAACWRGHWHRSRSRAASSPG